MQVAYALTQLVQNLDRTQWVVTAQWRFSWFVMTVFVQSIPGIQAASALRRGSMFDVMGSNDVTQRGSRPKTKVNRDENPESIIDGCESEKRRDWFAVQTYPGPRKGSSYF